MLVVVTSAIAILGSGCQLLPSLLSPLEPSERDDNQPTTIESDSNGAVEPETVEAVTPESSAAEPEPDTSDAIATSQPSSADSASASSPAAATASSDPFPDAINQASSAFTLSQSAQSRDDWRLVANRWQQAIELMTTVPASSPYHGEAQQKLTEYRRNLSYARQQASMPLPESEPGRIIAVPIPSSSPSSTAAVPRPQSSQSSPAPTSESLAGRVYRAPIVRRSGGTPVVLVTFNGNQQFEMIVDTGASGTVITQPMARAMGITPVGTTSVATASASSATFALGYIDSMEVGGSRRGRMLVAIAPTLEIGLLGHDFFGRYDVTVRQDVVEFRER